MHGGRVEKEVVGGWRMVGPIELSRCSPGRVRRFNDQSGREGSGTISDGLLTEGNRQTKSW